MSDSDLNTRRRARMAEAVRQVVSRRERAARSPRMERALKRLIWRYHRELRVSTDLKAPMSQGSESKRELGVEKARKVEDV